MYLYSCDIILCIFTSAAFNIVDHYSALMKDILLFDGEIATESEIAIVCTNGSS